MKLREPVALKLYRRHAFYHYHLSKVIHSSRTWGVYKAVDILTCNDYTGATELCTLFLKEKIPTKYTAKLRSHVCCLLISTDSALPIPLAEMLVCLMKMAIAHLAVVGRALFSMDFPTADYLTAGQKVFIAELMPKYPIYVNLLSKEAQQVGEGTLRLPLSC